MTDPIRIDGIRQLAKAAKAVDAEAPKEIKAILNSAAEIVVKGAQRRVPVKTGALRNSIKVGSSATKAQVKSGSKRVPYAGFVDFGGNRKRGSRPYVRAGRFVLPAYEAQKQNIAAMMQKRLNAFVAEKGF